MTLSEGIVRRKKQIRSMNNPVVLGYTETDEGQYDYYNDKYHIIFLSTYVNTDDVVVARCNDSPLDNSSEFTTYDDLRDALKQDKTICSDCIKSMYNLWTR